MTEEFYIGQIFEGEYPPEAADWCNARQDSCIDEIEPQGDVRRWQIVAIPEPTPEEIRQRLDALTLTPSDVERALFAARGWDFDDLKAFIVQQIPTINVKSLSIEFRAKDFYRGAEYNGMRLFDVVGQLLGYSSDDMDYLFEHKELPAGE